MQVTDNSGCKGCGGCSCNKAEEVIKEYYTAPDGAVYEVGKGDYAEPGKVYLNSYGVFLAENGEHCTTDGCEDCCASWHRSFEGLGSFDSTVERQFLCDDLPGCHSFDVVYNCIESKVDWLKVDYQ